MSDYPGLAALRSGLTTDDPDQRAEAYGSVLNADVQPSQVLEASPDEAVVQALVEADVIPEDADADREPAAVQRQKMVELLKQIEANTGGA